MISQATLTEIRKDGMQKWERNEIPRGNHLRYVWINAYQSKPEAKLDCVAELEFVKGTGGMIGGHWAGWRVNKII